MNRTPSLEDLLPRADGSVYKLARLAAKRALELSDGRPSLLDEKGSDKFTTLALQEIEAGKVQTAGSAAVHKAQAEAKEAKEAAEAAEAAV